MSGAVPAEFLLLPNTKNEINLRPGFLINFQNGVNRKLAILATFEISVENLIAKSILEILNPPDDHKNLDVVFNLV